MNSFSYGLMAVLVASLAALTPLPAFGHEAPADDPLVEPAHFEYQELEALPSQPVAEDSDQTDHSEHLVAGIVLAVWVGTMAVQEYRRKRSLAPLKTT